MLFNFPLWNIIKRQLMPPGIVPLPVGLAIGAGVLSGATNIIGGLAGRRDFPVSEQDIINQFNQQLERGRSQVARGARQRATAAGLGGSGVISNIISDLQTNFATAIEQQRQQALNNLRLQRAQFEAQQPTTGQIVAGGVSSGLQTGLNVAALGGQFDNLLRSTPPLFNAGGPSPAPISANNNGIGLQFTPGQSPVSVQPPAFVTQNTFSVNRLNPFNQ